MAKKMAKKNEIWALHRNTHSKCGIIMLTPGSSKADAEKELARAISQSSYGLDLYIARID